jgi:glycosyltransferase involved in cell wall biosynthesis
MEYIVIDGGSMDGTVEIIKNYESQIAYWHSRPDRGLAHAFNLGLEQSRGNWLLFLNADDFFLDNSVVEQMVPYLMIHRTADVVFGGVMSVSRHKVPTPLPLLRIYFGHPWRWQEFRWYNTIPHQAAFTSRNFFEKVGHFDESLRIVIDYEFYLRAGKRLKAQFIPINISATRLGGLSENHQQMVRREDERRRVQRKARALPNVVCWLYFFWKFVRFYLLKGIHQVLDPYAHRFSFKNRMSGDLAKSLNETCRKNV